MPTASFGPRGIPTCAQIYPPHLSRLYAIQTKTRWVTPIVVAAGLGYGAAQYARTRMGQARAVSQAEESERLRRMSALMDAYGDRESMASLENASRVYEGQQQQQSQMGSAKAGNGR